MQDNLMSYIRKRVFWTPYDMNGVDETVTSMQHKSSLTDGVTIVEVGTTGLIGWDMDAGEFIGGGLPVPNDLDPRYELGFKVHYTGTVSGTTGTNTWLLLYGIIAEDAAIAVAATALNTVIGADAYGANTDNLNKISPRGIALASSHQLTREKIEAGAKLMLKLELDVSTNMDSAVFIQLEMDYVPQLCVGPGSDQDRPLITKYA